MKWPKARQQTPHIGWRGQPERRAEQDRRAPSDPDTIMANGRVRITKLETTMQSVRESDPMYPNLLEALKTARNQAHVKPLQDRIAGTESFLERARKRVVHARQEVDNAREKLAGHCRGQVGPRGRWPRLSALREEAYGMPRNPPPTVPADFVQKLTRLQSFVEEFRRERDEFRAELVAQTATESRPRKSNRSLSTPAPNLGDVSSSQMVASTAKRSAPELSTLMETLIDRAEFAVRFSQSVPMNFT